MENSMKRIVIIIIISLMTGCAAGQQQELVRVFYPSPPDLARMQFLTTFTGEKDIAERKSSFENFVTGGKDSGRRLDKPYGVALRGGKLYVCDENHTVMYFDLAKRTYGQLLGAQGLGKLMQPINIRIDREGTKYVSDAVREQVVVFDKNDYYVNVFGQPGTWKPTDAVPYEDQLYVSDIKNAVIVVLDKKNGTVLRQFGQEGPPAERLSRPTNLAFDSEGHLYISDAGRFQVVKMDRDGHFLGTVGTLGTHSGAFARPRGIALDRKNRLYAVDAAFDNVQLFSDSGRLLFYFGQAGSGPGDLFLPSQVIVDYDHAQFFQQYTDPNFEIENLVIVANQFGDKLINVYGFGKERGKKYPSDEELLEQRNARLKKAEKDRPPENKGEPAPQKK
jgi:DNA-binding beta-propeller fold protein YncE